MKTLLIDNEIKYEGWQLCPHWIYRNFKIQGDATVAFVGECEVKLTEMVDIEDVINDESIYSKSMLSFISEQFNVGLVEGVFRQRLLICIIKEALEKRGFKITRNGDDLFFDGKKLTANDILEFDADDYVLIEYYAKELVAPKNLLQQEM